MVWEGRDAVKTGRGMFSSSTPRHPPLTPSPTTLYPANNVNSPSRCYQPSCFCTRYYPRSVLLPRAPSQQPPSLSLLFFYLLLVLQIKILTPDVGDYAIDVGRNVCHGSDSVENAKKEIALWFKEGEVQSYKSSQHDWIYEKP